MSATIKPEVYASITKTAHATIKPEIYASITKTAHATVKPEIYASVIEVEPPPPEPLDEPVIITPAGIAIASESSSQTNVTPTIAASKIGRGITIGGFCIAVTFYTPPSPSFISKYKPQIAVSFYPPAEHFFFCFSHKADLPIFPEELNKFSWKSSKTLSWASTLATSAAGKSRTLSSQVSPKITFEVKLAHITDGGTKILFNFIRKVHGAQNPFLWYDEDSFCVRNEILPRDGFGYYRLPFNPLGIPYSEYAWYIGKLKVWLGGEELPQKRFSLYKGAVVILDANGYEIKTDLPEVRASFTYYWKVHFIDDNQGIERIFQNFNRSKTIKMEVRR